MIRLDRTARRLEELKVKLTGSAGSMPSNTSFVEFQKYLSTTTAIHAELQAAKQIRRNGRKTRLEEVLSAMLSSRILKIDSLLKVFESEALDSLESYKPLSIYLDSLNAFLKDSSKELFFDQADNNLYYKRLDENSELESKSKELLHLSSGEKQIVIMLTYLAFLAEPGSIFILDEPELSLHLKWQQKLVPAIQILCPKDCQIILATHAPEIAGRARENCVRLN